VIDFQLDRERYSSHPHLDPVLVAFRLSFQFYIKEFSDLMDYLRSEGLIATLTMGGHSPPDYENARLRRVSTAGLV